MNGRTAIILGVLLVAAAAAAQDAPQVPRAGNPHGDMDLDCKLCHTEDSWALTTDGGFDHGTTGFPLEGMHVSVKCKDCHREPVFAHVGTHCADCHSDIHRGRLGPSCANCHSPAAWVDQPQARRDHDETSFPLIGAHERVDCEACHSGAVTGDYVGTPTECYACHREDYESTDNPNHQVAGFATDCERCHGAYSSTWGSGDFIHSQNFPLTGEHARISCADCHESGFAGTPIACATCHQGDYDRTTNPQHALAGFPTECALCHSTTGWVPGKYDHDATAFPLTGAHRTLECLSCHETGFSGTPSDCYACHRIQYDNTTGPNHAASNFPVSCQDCHSTSAWEPASWDHDSLFPIYSGRHRGVWTSCAECHVVQSDYSQFECILCHEHNQTDMDQAHLGEVPNYRYLSSACYECHPRGEGD